MLGIGNKLEANWTLSGNQQAACLASAAWYHTNQKNTSEVFTKGLLTNVGKVPELLDTLPTQTTENL